ncbi:MAG: hypothetical protein M3457_00595 [Chloroflexota bacterium]|nr:hypothetical protein [Chloroflexota bacterium]
MTMLKTPAAPAFKSRVFLWGADMNPTTIRSRWPNGRFVAIARAAGRLTRTAGMPKEAFGPEIWGIIVETRVEQQGTPLPLTLPDGVSATAMLAGEPGSLGTPADILAEANYWELPQTYRDRIQAFIESAPES